MTWQSREADFLADLDAKEARGELPAWVPYTFTSAEVIVAAYGMKVVVNNTIDSEPRGFIPRRFWWMNEDSWHIHSRWCENFFTVKHRIYVNRRHSIVSCNQEVVRILKQNINERPSVDVL